MTVPSTRFREDYAGNGSATSFPYAFRIFKATDLVVTKTDNSGNETTLTLGTDYTVTGAGSYNGGAVVLTTALPTSYRLTIERVLAIRQDTDLRNQGEFLAETHEDAFDRLTMIVQRLAGYLGMGQGGTLRTLLLGTGDVDGAGAFRARQNRIQDLGDPVNMKDAANKQWTLTQIAASMFDSVGNALLQLLASSDVGKGAALIGYRPSEQGAAATTVDAKLREILSDGQIPLRPAYLDQFISGFFGRGMLTAETVSIATEQFLTAAASAGASAVSVTSAANFLVGGCVTIKHDNGRYGTYFVGSKNGNNLDIYPSLRYAVSTSSKIERTWYNRAHPGKFYMRELAQRVARLTELEASMPDGGRALFTNLTNNATAYEDQLVPIGGAAINYYPASNDGANGLSSPVRFAIGQTAYIENLTVGAGAETRLFAIESDGDYVAKVIFAANNATSAFKIEILDETGKQYNEILATYTVPNGNNQLVLQVYSIPFNSRSAKYFKARITCQSNPTGYFVLDQIDVFKAPVANGKVISKRGARIVCLGDSWMAGDLSNTPEREPITTQLALELPDATIINAGIGGNAIWHELARFETDVAAHNPDYVVVNTGTNECYNTASAIFDPNSIDYFIYQYRLLINKIIGIGAKPIIIGVPALAQSDTEGSFTNWALNDRARGYAKAFYEWQGVRPPALGAHYGLESYRTDATLTSGTTPSVAHMRRVDLNYPIATTITNLLGGVSGQVITLVSRNGNVTLEHGTLLLHGAANVTLTINSTITLMKLDVGVSAGWVEIGRSLVQPLGAVEITLTSGTTPSVAGAKYVNLSYPSSTTITDFTGGVTNQEIQVRATNGNVTLTHGVFQLQGSANVTLTNNSVITLRKLDITQTSAWVEVSRSIK